MKRVFSLSIYKSKRYSRAVSLIGLTALLILGFPQISQPQSTPLTLLHSGYGPEDLVLDSLHNPPRILVSCSSRRPEYPKYGEIEAFIPETGARTILTRTGEPKGLVFRPHGISLVQAGEIQYLYVISHDDQKGRHPVIQYGLENDQLIFIRMISSPLLISPNALQAYPDGSILVCNDAAERNSMKEKIFKLKRGNVVFFDESGNGSKVAKELGMPAGLTADGNTVYVSAALENRIYSFQYSDGQLSNKEIVSKIKGPDNIRIHNSRLIVTSHSKPFRFISHVKNSHRRSPSLVLSVDPHTGKSLRLFYDSGQKISAASAAIIVNNQLVIGQIFEPLIGIMNIGSH